MLRFTHKQIMLKFSSSLMNESNVYVPLQLHATYQSPLAAVGRQDPGSITITKAAPVKNLTMVGVWVTPITLRHQRNVTRTARFPWHQVQYLIGLLFELWWSRKFSFGVILWSEICISAKELEKKKSSEKVSKVVALETPWMRSVLADTD